MISGAEKALETLFHLNPFWLGFTVATALIGTIFGSVIIERPADLWGRKKTLFLLAILYFVSSVGCAVAPNWLTLVVSRFIGGIAIGGASVVAPMYIAEISPAHLRGRLVAVNQLNVVVGILLSFISNYLVAQFLPGPDAWRWMLGIVAVPSIAFFFLLFGIAESPRWLVKVGRMKEAADTLKRLGHADVEGKVRDIQNSLSGDLQQDRLFQSKYMWPLFLAFAIAMFNQLSGINALMYYAPRIFEMAGAAQRLRLAPEHRGRGNESRLHHPRHGAHRFCRTPQTHHLGLIRLHRQPRHGGMGILFLRRPFHGLRRSHCPREPPRLPGFARL